MTRDMNGGLRFRGELAVLVGVVACVACYGTPRTSLPDAGSGGAGRGGASGTGGSQAGGTGRGGTSGGSGGTARGGAGGSAAGTGGTGIAGSGAGARGGMGGPTGGSGGGSLAIAIASPASPAYTNKAIEIDVSVNAAGASPTVQLLDNGVLLTTLSGAPYVFTWDTTQAAEGNHNLVAQAAIGGEIVASAPVAIIVDRTPPSIVSRSPGSAADNVSLTDPIQVVFSEAIAPASVTASAVKLALGSTAASGTATLGPDGKTINVVVADRASLALPGTMTETVATSITDLAGNSFTGGSWSFAVPLWVDLGTLAGSFPQIALDPTGALVAMTRTASLQIARHRGGTNWDTSIPSPQAAGAMAFGTIAISASGDIFLAWIDSSSQPINVARWTGSTWDRSYSTLLTSPTASTSTPSIAITRSGQPVVRWVEPVNMGRGPGYVSRWNGSSWTPYPDAPGDYWGPLVLDQSDMPIVLAGNHISRWTGSAWTSPQGMKLYGLAINSADQGVALGVDSILQPVALSKSGALTNYVPALTGESPLGAFGIAINQAGEPIITWNSYAGGPASNAQLHVSRWTGAEWDQRYGTLPDAGDACSIVLVGASVPVIAWHDSTATSTRIAKSNH